MKHNKNKKKKVRDFFSEFSKFILFLFAVNYFIGGIFILWVVQFQLTHTVTPEYISAEAVVTYFSAPIVAGMVGYFGKAAVENCQKISGSNKLKLLGVGDQPSEETETEPKIARG